MDCSENKEAGQKGPYANRLAAKHQSCDLEKGWNRDQAFEPACAAKSCYFYVDFELDATTLEMDNLLSAAGFVQLRIQPILLEKAKGGECRITALWYGSMKKKLLFATSDAFQLRSTEGR